jgi:hypothetical protein
MRNVLVVTALVVLAMTAGVSGAGAQIPPIDLPTDPVEETVDEVVDVVDEATEVVTETAQTVGQAAGQAAAAGQVTGGGSGPAGSVGGVQGGGGVLNPGSLSSSTSEPQSSEGGGATQGAGSPPTGGASGGKARGGGQAKGRPGAGTEAARGTGVVGGPAQLSRVMLETVAPAAYIPLLVQLTNDADGDGTYSDSEAAPFPRTDVPFQLRLQNDGVHALTITAIRDASPTPIASSVPTTCTELVGTALAPGQSTVCRFTAAEFAPPLGERSVIVYEVDVVEASDAALAGTVTDTALVTTGESGVLGVFVRRGLDGLATTGANIGLLMTLALALAVTGALCVARANRRTGSRSIVSRQAPAFLLSGAHAPRPGSTANRRLPGVHRPTRRAGSSAGRTRAGVR